MAFVKRQVSVLLIISLIVLASGGIYLIIMFLPINDTQSYDKLSELPASFVINCKKIAGKFGIEWEILAAIAQVRVEHGLLDSYPKPEELLSLAEKISLNSNTKSINKIIRTLGYPSDIAREVEVRTKLFEENKKLFSNNYSFPYRQKVYYADTWGADREGGKRLHQGTDLFAPEGTSVFSVYAGKIENLGWNRLGGERVGVRGEDKIYYYYAHLSQINPRLKVGMKVDRGALLGFTGHTGDAITTPDHLHFGMETPAGKWVNPYNFLQYWNTCE